MKMMIRPLENSLQDSVTGINERKILKAAMTSSRRVQGSADLELSVSSLRLDALLGEVGETFHEVLFQRIARSGMSDVEVYKRANIDRKLFSKIRANPAYHPRKNTVLALAIALRMNLEETQDLLSRAEYALSPSSKADVIIRYFIEHRMYDIDLINIVLYDYGLAVLG